MYVYYKAKVGHQVFQGNILKKGRATMTYKGFPSPSSNILPQMK